MSEIPSIRWTLDLPAADHKHKLQDAHATSDGYGINCMCGVGWEFHADSEYTLDDMAEAARLHVEDSCHEDRSVDPIG